MLNGAVTMKKTPDLRLSVELSPCPEHAPDNVEIGRRAVRPVGIGRIVGLDRDALVERVDGKALDEQAILDPQHVDAVAQPLRRIGVVDQDVVTRLQRGRHRIPFDADDRQLLGPRGGQCLEPRRIDRDRIILIECRSVDWQSLTFIGERHEVSLRLPPPRSNEALAALMDGLEDAEFEIPGNVLVDIALMGSPVEEQDGSILVDLEALTIRDAD